MALPETHLRQIARWCEQKVPARIRGQVRVEHTVRGSSVTIVEHRSDLGPEWTKQPIAQLRYADANWQLYWPDRNRRWHLYPDAPVPASPGPLLEVIDQPDSPFWP